jgi:phosphohistidine phosphatase
MELYLVQHGEAMSEGENPERPLSVRGREDVQRVSAVAARLGLRPAEIRHSGKRRAAETAEIFAAALGVRKRVVAVAGMAPNDDVGPVASALATMPQSLMLVGHLPFLSRLASLLLVGDPERTLARFRMGGIVCLTRDPSGAGGTAGGWMVAWMVTPELAI